MQYPVSTAGKLGGRPGIGGRLSASRRRHERGVQALTSPGERQVLAIVVLWLPLSAVGLTGDAFVGTVFCGHEAVGLANQLLAAGGLLGDASTLDEIGARTFAYLAPASPASALAAIERRLYRTAP
jgi:hypothetical protein